MNLRYRDFAYLARFVIGFLHKKEGVDFHGKEEVLAQSIVQVLEKNFEEEEQISEQARKLLEANRAKVGMNIDEDKALSMIRKQLAKEKGFVL